MPKTEASQRQKTIYNNDGSLNGNRTIDGDGKTLTLQNMPEINLSAVSGTKSALLQLQPDNSLLNLAYLNSASGANNAITFSETQSILSANNLISGDAAAFYVDTSGKAYIYTQGIGGHSNGEVVTLIDNTTGEVDYAPAAGGSGTVTSITASSPLTGGTITTSGSIGIADAVADGSTKGAASFTANDFNSSSGNISIDYTNGQAADASHKGFLTSTDWSTFNSKGSGTVTSVTGTTNRITSSGGTTPAIDISASYVGQTSLTTLGTIGTGTWQGTKIGLAYGGTNADLSATGGAANYLKQITSGAAVTVGTIPESDLTFTNITTNNVSTSKHGFAPILPNDATKYLDGTGAYSIPAGTGVTSVTGTTNRITSSGGATPAIDISATFEALLGKVANPLSQFAATTSAQLAGVISDETGSGLVVFNNAPSLTSPTMTTQSAGDNTTKGASTAFVTTAISNALAGVNPAVSVAAATTAALATNVYFNGASGIGATITITTPAVLVIDGYTVNLNDRVLIKNEGTPANNGVYVVTTLGTVAISAVLTRALDYDQPSDINNSGAIPVINGTVNAVTQWVITTAVTTVGTDPLTYSQFSANPATLAPLASPTFTGTPTAPTASVGTNTTQIATTAFVQSASLSMIGLAIMLSQTNYTL